LSGHFEIGRWRYCALGKFPNPHRPPNALGPPPARDWRLLSETTAGGAGSFGQNLLIQKLVEMSAVGGGARQVRTAVHGKSTAVHVSTTID